MNIEALLLSARLHSSVSAILFVVGVPLAYWLAYSPMAMEISVGGGCGVAAGAATDRVGILLLWRWGPRGALGKLWSAAFGARTGVTSRAWWIASVLYRPAICSATADRLL